MIRPAAVIRTCVLAIGAFAAIAVHPTRAADMFSAIVYGDSGPFDKGFNQSARMGTLRFRDEFGLSTRGHEIGPSRTAAEAMEKAVAEGANIIITLGFNNAEALAGAAVRHPDLRFVLIDAMVDQPNVRSILFGDSEAGALAGVLAASVTTSRKVAFLGGMDIAVIRRFEHGFRQGAALVDPGIEVLTGMTGATPSAFNDPYRGYRLGLSMLNQGADVIFAAAGSTGLGALQAAADRGVIAIGVDTDQNDLFPNAIVASVLKRVDLAVYQTLKDAWTGQWRAGTHVMQIADGGVALVFAPKAESRLGPDRLKRVEAITADIAVGRIAIENRP